MNSLAKLFFNLMLAVAALVLKSKANMNTDV